MDDDGRLGDGGVRITALTQLDDPGRHRREQWRHDPVDERGEKELAELGCKNRQLEMENEILKRAAVYFARENILPK